MTEELYPTPKENYNSTDEYARQILAEAKIGKNENKKTPSEEAAEIIAEVKELTSEKPVIPVIPSKEEIQNTPSDDADEIARKILAANPIIDTESSLNKKNKKLFGFAVALIGIAVIMAVVLSIITKK